MRREDIISDILKRNNYTKGVEVGSSNGEFSKEILKRWSGSLYLVDEWNNDKDSKSINECIDNISEFTNRAHIMKMPSNVANKLFGDETLDFVYLDANKSYDNFMNDFNNWYPKVKQGGLISGFNFMMINWYDGNFTENGKDKAIYIRDTFLGNFGINTAINELTAKLNLKISFTPELFSSWYFIKNS